MDVYSLPALTSEHDTKKAGVEIVKQSANAPFSGLLYPILQVLDEEYLKVNAEIGGLDQRKLFVAATEWLSKLGYRKRGHLVTPMVAGLSFSIEDSKIDLLGSPESLAKKIRKSEAIPKVVENNSIIAMVEYVLLPPQLLQARRNSALSAGTRNHQSTPTSNKSKITIQRILFNPPSNKARSSRCADPSQGTHQQKPTRPHLDGRKPTLRLTRHHQRRRRRSWIKVLVTQEPTSRQNSRSARRSRHRPFISVSFSILGSNASLGIACKGFDCDITSINRGKGPCSKLRLSC